MSEQYNYVKTNC